jgi:Zn-dependent M28 family amino/carboxypeptidase
MTMPVDGDWISNGADDDGSGTVALLELAQAYASMKPAPARKVLFCAFFGEEKGGLGSRFYVENPAHPMDKTVCDVNIEMIGRSFDVGKRVAWVTGYDYSDLGKTLAEGGAAIGVKIIPDPYPRQNFFLRSDNVAFVKHKVPGHSSSAGSTHPDYHGVNDEVDWIEFENMESIVRAVFLGAAPIADGSRTVRWTREIPRVR